MSASISGGDRATAGLSRLEDDASAVLAPPVHVRVMREWVRDYLAQPHDDLGRAGPVCPFARPALERHSLWTATIRGEAPPQSQVVAVMHDVLARFRELPSSGPDSLLNAALIAFPDVVDYTLIDRVQQDLKSDFVHEGLMVGQFYPGCREPGLWNRDFRPLESPVPLIAIRYMVSNDFPFLSSNPDWIETYLRRFAPEMPSQVRSTLAKGFGVEPEPGTRTVPPS